MAAKTRFGAVLVGMMLCSSIAGARAVDFLIRQLPWAVVGVPYDVKIETSIDGRCPRGDVGLEISGGSLPHGMAIVGERLVGTPARIGTFPVMVRAANSCGFEVKGFRLIVTAEPVLRIEPQELRFEYRDGYAKPAPQSLLVFSTWPNVPYSVETKDPWLSVSHAGITPEAGSESLADVAAVRVQVENLKPGVYQSTLKFTTPAFASAPTLQVTLKVAQ